MKSRITYSPDGRSVIKTCRSGAECAREIQVYNLNLPFTPRLIGIRNETTIELSLIRGESLANKTDFDFSQPARKLSQLHQALSQADKVLCHLDNNPRNYLIEQGTGYLYLIDFSDSGFSHPENDLVNFLLFWAAILLPENFQKAMKDFLLGYEALELLDNKRENPLFQEWRDLFDERRRRYCKKPGTVYDWQKINREYLEKNFYLLLEDKI